MGKARILSAQGEGLYSIEILEDRTRAESLKQRALQRIDEIDSELSGLESDLEQARQKVDDAAEAQDQAIEQHQAEILATGESSVDLQAPAQAVLDAAANRDAIRTRIGSLNLERLQQQGWIDRVDALPPLRTQEAWCADYTEDLEGEVATAEVPGEAKQVIIKPGFGGANQWSPSADGAMQPALASTPAGVFYNLAMMPGWQRWRPTFRVATISNINEDLCDITIDPATSSQQGLNVNAQGSYSGVPIYYMDCNGAAFEDGDRVLVAFSGNTEQPMVVGFEQEPKKCQSAFFMISGINLEESIDPSPYDVPRTYYWDGDEPMGDIPTGTNVVYASFDIDKSLVWTNPGRAYRVGFAYEASSTWDDSESDVLASYEMHVSTNTSVSGGNGGIGIYLGIVTDVDAETSGTIVLEGEEYIFSRKSRLALDGYGEEEKTGIFAAVYGDNDVIFTLVDSVDEIEFDGYTIDMAALADEIGVPNITLRSTYNAHERYSRAKEIYPEFLVEKNAGTIVVTIAVCTLDGEGYGTYLISIEKKSGTDGYSWRRVLTPWAHVNEFKDRSPRYAEEPDLRNVYRVFAGL